MPVLPEVRNPHTAPQPIKQNLILVQVQLNRMITAKKNSKNNTSYNNGTTTNVQTQKIGSMFCQKYMNENVSTMYDHTVKQVTSTMIAPLLETLECITNHYNKIINNTYQHIMNDTQSLTSHYTVMPHVSHPNN